ncbi:tetratricopeptide repeat protein [Fodinicola acaciae]|uniref:tetratricopeptide repeat protein n=1 Tax=Fodinicola acaciae TaxID=2681555 RepID=UPI0013D86AFA|nr:tetratricopeptide repeat protein [Fodinicola acaciae]
MRWFRRDGGQADRDAAAKKEFERGKRELEAGRFEAAVATFRRVVALTPDSPNSQFLLGVALYKAGDSAGAVEPLRRCVAMRPDHAEAHLVLGGSFGRLEDYDQADVHLAKAASLGNLQARERLAKVGADFCRKCAAPAKFSAGDTDADVVVAHFGMGLRCASCHAVLCGRCASGGHEGPMLRTCPDCGGRLDWLSG